MSRRRKIRIVGVPNTEPNIRLFVLALLELAKQMQAEAADEVGRPHGNIGGTHD